MKRVLPPQYMPSAGATSKDMEQERPSLRASTAAKADSASGVHAADGALQLAVGKTQHLGAGLAGRSLAGGDVTRAMEQAGLGSR